MPDSVLPPVTISGLPQAGEAHTGDQIETNQSGISRSITVGQIIALAAQIGPQPVLISTTPPVGTTSGDLWWSTELGELFVWYVDADSGQWVPASPSAHAALPEFDVRRYGAVGDGVHDDAPAIQAALNAAVAADAGAVIVPGGTYRIASTITVNSVELHGASFLPGAPVLGTRLVADATLGLAVRLVGDGSNGCATLSNLTVTRAGVNPVTSTIGIQMYGGYNCSFTNVKSENHGICWYFKSIFPGVSGAGISVHLTNCDSARATDAHCVIDGMPEIYWVNGRFGDNGGGDYNCNTHLRCQGGNTVSSAGGPNTVKMIGVQFNQGSSITSVRHFWEFVNLTLPIPQTDTSLMDLTNCHVEGINEAVVYSDASWNYLWRWQWVGNSFNCPAVPMFALAPNTTPAEWSLYGNFFWTQTFNLTPSAQMNQVNISGGIISGSMHVTGTSGSSLMMSGVSHQNVFTLDGTWGSCTISGPIFTFGSLTNNATGNVAIFGGNGGQHMDIHAPDGQSSALFRGSARAVRFVPSVNEFEIAGVDITGSTSYQPLVVGGSTVSLQSNVVTQAYVDGVGLHATSYLRINAVTVSTLATPATAVGLRSFVTDATTTTFGAVVVGGGANKVPVYSDGVAWRIG